MTFCISGITLLKKRINKWVIKWAVLLWDLTSIGISLFLHGVWVSVQRNDKSPPKTPICTDFQKKSMIIQQNQICSWTFISCSWRPICPVWTCLIFLFSLGCFGSWVWEMVDECVLWESLKEGCTACYQSCLVNMITAFTPHHIKSQMLCDISTIVNSKEAFLKYSDPSLKLDACCQRWKRQRSDLRELVAEGANAKLSVLWLLREEAEMHCHLLQFQWGSFASLQLCLWWKRYGCLATASGESSAFNLCLPLS